MDNVILNRFATRSWLGSEVLIYSEIPEYGERLIERLSKLNPHHELKTHAFTKYNDAHDFAKKLKTLGILIVIESEQQTHPLQDIIRELLVPFESRGTPGISLLFAEKNLSVRGAIGAKKAPSCIDYLPYSFTESNEHLLKIFKNLTTEIEKKFEEKVFPLSTQDFFSKIRGQSEENRQFEERLSDHLTSKLNLSWMETLKVKWGVSIFGVSEKLPESIEGSLFEKLVSLKKIKLYQTPLPLHVSISTAELPHVVTGLIYKLSEDAKNEDFKKCLNQFIPDEAPSSFEDGYFRMLYREKKSIESIYNEYYEQRDAKNKVYSDEKMLKIKRKIS